MTSIFWLAAFVILVGIELGTMALTTIWFAGGALAGFVCSLLDFSVEIQLGVFLIVSLVLLFFTRPFAVKYINKGTVKTNAESLVGQTARVTAKICNEQGMGTAVMNGQEWTARSADPSVIIPAGTMVRIEEIQGVKLIVTILKED